MNKLVFFTAVVALAAGCSSKLFPDRMWKEKKWILIELNSTPVQLSGTDKDAHIIFMPDENRFGGSGGCNRVSGSYSMGKKELSFSKVLSTRMACPDLAFEDKYLELLGQVNAYQLKEGELIMKNGNKVLLKFK